MSEKVKVNPTVLEIIETVNDRCRKAGMKTIDRQTGFVKPEFFLPSEIKDLLVEEYNRLEKNKTNLALVKFFYGAWTWWASEYDPETGNCYGLTQSQERELGYFNLEEVRTAALVNRDFWFTPTKLDQCYL